ncbi:zinc finger protein 507 [Toxotes jaculatrix]|uniref:zinc finger protein 507 n=1 Tax=Toxotes jaculatrix TaxID=941984 RepID=UPI001B3AB493|nr:zinc finger protein 507 [Toxotes jaculatrix]XP_040892411.1 zinc finger protein 507 [Toxotes jaculatrix]
MEEISNVAVLITHSSTVSSSSSTPSALQSPSQTQNQQEVQDTSHSFQHKQAPDSLIQVIEKLSKIVEKRPQRRCTLAGPKRAFQQASSLQGGGGEEGARRSRGGSPNKKIKRNCKEQESIEVMRLDGSIADGALSPPVSGDSNNNNITSTVTEVGNASSSSNHKRTVTCYQCSLCPYLSQTLPLLKEHLKQHNEQHSDLILMCSECRFTSRDHGQLEEHVRLHFDNGGNLKRNSTQLDTYAEGKEEVLRKQDGDWTGSGGSLGTEVIKGSLDGSKELPQKKKWYSYEEYGLYRCLICSYVCSQQRMLKTHAWKHAGLVDCSYPIFEDEDGAPTMREAQAAANTAATREEIVVLSPVLQDKSLQKLPTSFKLQLCVPLAVDNKQNVLNHPVANISESPKTAGEEEESVYPIKDLTSEEPMVEVQVTTEAETEVELDRHHDSTSVTDSLLSSAQKIINSSPNSAGHINVIVERLPSAEDSVMATNPLLLRPDVDRAKSLLHAEEEERDHVGAAKDEVLLGCSAGATDRQPLGADIKSSVAISNSPRDENIPPAGRKRTHSESLRLHSLAAEALVAMPMRTPEFPTSSTKVGAKTITAQAQSPNVGQKLVEVSTAGQKSSDIGTTAALLDLELHSGGREEELGSLDLGEGDEEGPATKAGISLSLLTVIERLRERSDQNASDEDILKELQDNAQFQNGAMAGVVTGNGAGSYMRTIPGMDGLVASPDGGLVDYIPGSERPYRCRLCHYSSGNKGYIKQHLRVHRQREPYQCPICEHIASDSKDLESHMIHHCKTRMYQCKQCPDAFHYKSQLRNHERDHHSFSGDMAGLTPVTETVATVEEAERVTDEECQMQKMYKCDVCDYTSSTYVGVRNHRRIHNSDKPYRCCSCDFATTNMNSLKSHMRRHPQEHQAVQLLEQYRCSLCGYVCSHPPSLKSHMWKHAGDQNYNYEQVNKAINEAISQSSRAPQKLSAVLESVAERPAVAQPSKDKVKGPVEPVPAPTTTTTTAAAAVDLAVDRSAGLPKPTTDPSQWPGESPSPQGKDPAQLQSQAQSQPRTTQAPVPGPSMEYCVLLFCCCICGFESTSKERLMEHMKEHEGDIISIILNKEHQQQQQPEAQPSLQTAESVVASEGSRP